MDAADRFACIWQLQSVAMGAANSYQEWTTAALADDLRSGAQRWKADDRSRRYDYKVIRRRHDEIRAVKAQGDPTRCCIT